MSAGRRGSRCSARPRNWRPSRRKLAYRDRLDFRSCGQAPVRNGFTLASLCRCGVPSGDFGIGVVTQGSDRPLDKALWAEIEIDEIAAYTIAQTLPEPMANSAIRKRQAKGSRVALGRSLSACWAAGRLWTAKATASPCRRGTTSTRLCIRGRCSVKQNSPPVKSAPGSDNKIATCKGKASSP
jgi:hypothetical protein